MDTQFLSNTSVSDGGGVYASGPAALSDGLFSGNECTDSTCRGGGMYAGSTLTLTGTQFLTNAAVYLGGGAYAYGAATANGGLFAGNQCTDAFCYGGGLYVFSTASLTGTQLLSNSAAYIGGGLFATNMVLTNTGFYGNSAASNGGGAASFDTASLQGGVFANNRCTAASCQGGGLYVSSVLTATDTQFVSNASALDGGAIYLFSNTPANSRVVNVLLARNQAGNTGAGIYLIGYDASSSLDVLHTTIVSPTLGAGAAIFVFSGTVNITNTVAASYATGIERVNGTVNEDYNLFFNVPVTTTGGVVSGGNSQSGDPVFANPALDDYHLGAGSAAMDAGANAGVTTDFEGDARPLGGGFDIGYDEAFFRIYLPLIRR
jgi:predicted outer membrane repeat protein